MILTIRDVERAVCLRFRISREDLRARNPKRVASRPRQIAMYLARELTGASYPRLGQYFERDHTSILYAWRKTIARMEKDARLKTDIEGVKEILTRSGRWKEDVARGQGAWPGRGAPGPS
jgi:chromosomal replication initiator protein